ncbi:hypothetical protein [Alteromonas antoniana]|uniref:hypothetical protein n=1 Tax=Alteromonas antoniana TaxID=2803813 RepID=UPI001C4399C9|nr:hypothetical protein [Alteromonas antoniana]
MKFKFDLSQLKKAFVGTANWDIYVDSEGRLYSVGKPERRGADGFNMDSMYGDKHHIKRLMSRGHFSDHPTEIGLELLSGLHSRFIGTGPQSADSAILSF